MCDHYSGIEGRMRKSLQLQAQMAQEFGACVFDVTLDCEDGAPVASGEATMPRWWRWLALASAGPGGGAVHPVDHAGVWPGRCHHCRQGRATA